MIIKRILKNIFNLILILLFTIILSSCETKKDDKNNLRVLINSGYRPYEMVNQKGEFYGFDIELINKLAELTGYKITIQDVSFDAIIDMIKNNQADLAISGITFTQERAKQVDFSQTYYRSQDTCYILFKKELDISKTEDLSNKRVGVQIGSIQEQTSFELSSLYNTKIEHLTNYADLLQELDKNKIDAIVLEKEVAKEIIKDNLKFNYFKLEVNTKLEGNCIVFPKNSFLTKKFDNALDTLKSNGFLDNLIKKYFG
ncbi:MAG: transporter substrate-binding domain-containing protein [Clostridiales bacterium]|jgi:polar amino acid transport system substrate-binding protein|nr:transporter substrate-binding domain-containing protein [Clostridiales bacterium]